MVDTKWTTLMTVLHVSVPVKQLAGQRTMTVTRSVAMKVKSASEVAAAKKCFAQTNRKASL